jgi:hypothetical protein
MPSNATARMRIAQYTLTKNKIFPNLLPYEHCTLAFATVCVLHAFNWLPYTQCTLAIVTVCVVNANKANHMLILPISLNQVLTNEKSKKAILTHSSGPQKNLKQLFCNNSKSKIIASVHCAYASKDKMMHIWPK